MSRIIYSLKNNNDFIIEETNYVLENLFVHLQLFFFRKFF